MITSSIPAAYTRRLLQPAASLLSDRVLLSLAAALAALALIDPGQARDSLGFALRSFAGIAPFLAIAVALAALTRATGADRLIAHAFAGQPARAVAIAALAGALSPFCSCGVVPIIAALLRSRVPLPPVMAFWIASPIMDPEMFILTAAGIGTDFAVAKTIATVAMGVFAGYGVYALRGYEAFMSPLRADRQGPACSAGLPTGPVQWRFWRVPERLAVFRSEAWSNTRFLAKWLLLAFFVEGLMIEYLPADAVAALLGSGAWYEIPLAALVGIPAYLNGYAAIPLMSGLMDMGMNPGAAMAFMTAGGVSSIPAAMAVAVLVRRPVFAAYIGLGLVGSTATALMYGLWI